VFPLIPLNAPNVLTVLRILMVPVVVVALLNETSEGDVIAAAMFALAALTDGLDGFLARLAAWVAMVIIAREFAVTGLRSVAAERGIVISASWLGKAKTGLQVAATIALIAVESSPAWVDALVYAAVAMTIISGADYFLGLRRHLDEADASDAARAAQSL
jgi:CDP-diacylglycerol--glycerol-3-phosphate 3-phosphatidyltransferase